MKTTLKKLLCIIIAISCVPVFGCSNKDSPTDAEVSVSESVADSTDENSESDDEDVGEITTTTTTKKTTTTRATTTTTTTTTPDVTVTDEGGEVVTGTDGKPIYVTTITDDEGEVVAVTTITDEDGEAVTDTDGEVVTATVALTTTVVTTTTTAPKTTTTTTKAQTVATTTTTAKPVTTTTKATTTAKPVTTTAPKQTAANGVCSTVVMAEGEAITVYYNNKSPTNATLQAYSDLAQNGVLTDEIRQIITADVMNYAITKYGCSHDTSLYANTPTDYNCGFAGGARNSNYSNSFETVALMLKWGALNSDYIMPSLDEQAKAFQARMYSWVDTTFEELEDASTNSNPALCVSNVGFCYYDTDADGYSVYLVAFLYA